MKKLSPFNIDLMFAPDSVVRSLRATTRTDIYDGVTSNFHEDGLFSITTFGKVGSKERDTNFSYIKLNVDVIHPAIFQVLKKLKRLYIDILMGTSYAKWNPETKDFEVSDMLEGDTGFAFFVRHLHHLSPDKRTSKKRNMYVDVFEKYKKECLMHNCLVIPAGMRDLYVDENDREVQDEINDMYRKLLSISSQINLVGARNNDSAVDIPRRNIQLTMNEIYDYLKSMLDGKKGLVQAKWGGRRIVNGTRNVISMMDGSGRKLGDPTVPTSDHTVVGLFECMKGALPILVNRLKTRFLNDVFINPSQPTTLIDRKSLRPIEINLDPYYWDKWGTTEGLEKLVEGFRDDKVRNNPITISGHYLYLVYKKGDTFKIIRSIDELPNPEMKEFVSPMTYSELYYLCDYNMWYEKLRALITRYPIDSVNSIYGSKVYCKTNNTARPMYELGDDWITKIGLAREYPGEGSNTFFINTVQIHASRLDSLGGIAPVYIVIYK